MNMRPPLPRAPRKDAKLPKEGSKVFERAKKVHLEGVEKMAEVGGILSKYVDKPDALAEVRAMLK